jgi:hypothetical protein
VSAVIDRVMPGGRAHRASYGGLRAKVAGIPLEDTRILRNGRLFPRASERGRPPVARPVDDRARRENHRWPDVALVPRSS